GGGLLAFVFRGDSTAGPSGARVHDLARLGIDPRETYRVVELLSGTAVGERSGGALAQAGLRAELPAYGSAVFRIVVGASGDRSRA
ncbi:MAG: hypothetical protein L0206_21660, partial [Actinobacteria bacterium]|nr:hypothetical protein [Actinomycetota bacterium]